MVKEVYLDNSATTRPYNEVVDMMDTLYKAKYGNPSSLHNKGVEAAQEITRAREIIASSLDLEQNRIYFTSGGTEANNLAILGAAHAYKHMGKHLITTTIEHPSVINSFKHLEECGFDVDYLDVDSSGFVCLNHLEKLLRSDTILVSVMLINNEVGSIQPVKKISQIVKSRKPDAIFHVDAVQAYGKIPISADEMGIDLLTMSAHKIHGPKGVGALYAKEGIYIKPILFGGGQENDFRSGTENVPAICGFGKAVEISLGKLEENNQRMRSLKRLLAARIREFFPGSILNTPAELDSELNTISASHILNASFKDVHASDLVQSLNEKGIYVSTRSACSCNRKNYSHVLKAMGMDNERIESAIRFSFSSFNTEEEIEYTVNALKESIQSLYH